MRPSQNDGEWTDVPADPSPRVIPGEVDAGALQGKVRAIAERSAELRRAVQESNEQAKVSVVSVSETRGTVRVTEPHSRTREEKWQHNSTGWHRTGG